MPTSRLSSLRPSARSLQVSKHVAGRYCWGTSGNVIICFWMDTCTPTELRELKTVYRALAAACENKVSALHYVDANAKLPLPELRADFVSEGKLDLGILGCVGVVLAGAGFWVSALSSFIVGVRLLMPKNLLAFRLTRDLEELAPWFIAEHERSTGERLHASQLSMWIEQARTANARD